MWWLTYRRDGKLVGVMIVKFASLIHARLRAALDEADAGLEFAKGHELDEKTAGPVPTKSIGRMLSIEEAGKLLGRLGDWRKYPKAHRGPSRSPSARARRILIRASA
jgi:hypothetical protein